MHPFDENKVTYFAETDARNKRVPFGIKAKDRTRHMYVIGKTGMGKSTLLENMAVQDIKNGEGMAFMDPHGKTADLFLDYIPEERINDVVYFAPFDTDYPISFNIMEDVGYDKRHLVVSGLMSAFKKIWVDAWSARMEYILSNVLLALLEYPGSTLLGINRMLTDKAYRKKVVDNIKDPSVRSFWVDEFAKYTDRYTQEATPAIQNKVGQFTANPLIRNIVGQPTSSFDIRKMMDEQKILIINLSKGLVGEGNANLLGSMLITKIYLAAMSRADAPAEVMKRLPNFYLSVDEFQSFANESFADILSEARKYHLNLTMAHQYIEQMSEEVRAAVFGNIGTMVTFRVGAYDAEVLEKEFAPVFTAEDLVNLGFAQIYLKLMIDGVSSHPFSATTLPPIEKAARSSRDAVIAASRRNYARSRADVEQTINEWYKPVEGRDGEETVAPRSRPSGDAGRPQRDRGEVPPRTEGRRSEDQHRSVLREEHRAQGDRRTSPRRHEESSAPPAVSLGALKEKGSVTNGRRDLPPLPESNHKDALKEALAAVLKKEAAPQSISSAPKTETESQASKEAPHAESPKEPVAHKDEQKFRTGEPAPKEVPEDVLRSILDISDET